MNRSSLRRRCFGLVLLFAWSLAAPAWAAEEPSTAEDPRPYSNVERTLVRTSTILLGVTFVCSAVVVYIDKMGGLAQFPAVQNVQNWAAAIALGAIGIFATSLVSEGVIAHLANQVHFQKARQIADELYSHLLRLDPALEGELRYLLDHGTLANPILAIGDAEYWQGIGRSPEGRAWVEKFLSLVESLGARLDRLDQVTLKRDPTLDRFHRGCERAILTEKIKASVAGEL